MENNNNMTAKNPWEDQRKAALELYEEMCAKSHHWSSFIQRAIEAYKEPESRASHPEPMEVEKKGPWRYEAKTWSIADTGDYDGHYEITNGKITLICKDEPDEADAYFKPLITALNNLENIEVDEGPYWSAGFDEGMKVAQHSPATPPEPAKENTDQLREEAERLYPAPNLMKFGSYESDKREEWEVELQRNAFIAGAKSQHLNKKEVAENLLKFIGSKNWYVNDDGSVWEDAYTGLPSTRTISIDEFWNGFQTFLNSL